MYSINRVLVGLDLTDQDKYLIRYISKLSHISDMDTVYFVHIANDLDLPEDLVKKYPDLVVPLDETLKHNIEFNIKKHGNLRSGVNVEIIIDEGNKKKVLLKLISRKDIDLVAIGRKSNDEAKLAFVRNIVRLAPCSVSIIPHNIPDKLKKILLPIDFSENSFMALEMGEYLSEKFSGLQIIGLNIYEVPSGFSKTGKSYDEFAEIMKSNAKKESAKFLKKHNIELPNLKMVYQLKDDEAIPDMIYEYANKYFCDAIVIGSRGRNAFSSFLIGSIAETIIPRDESIPLIIVKSKNDALTLMDALKII